MKTPRRNFFAYRKDKIHDPTVQELERDGHTSVQNAAGAGGGFPDLVVGTSSGFTVTGDPVAVRALLQALRSTPLPGVRLHDGANLIVELKSSHRDDSRNTGKATRDRQASWRRRWLGQQAKTYSIEETLALFGRRPSPLFNAELHTPTSCLSEISLSSTEKEPPRPASPARRSRSSKTGR